MELQLNQIINQDCIAYMRTLPNECIDLIIADPPYFEIVKDKWDNQWNTKQEYIEWCKEWIIECKRILKPTGIFYLWGCYRST